MPLEAFVAVMEEEEDSRTFAVGRKRDLGAMEVEKEHEVEAFSSSEDSRSHKRVKRSAVLADNETVGSEPLNPLESSNAIIPHAQDLASILPDSSEGHTPLIHTGLLADPDGQQVIRSASRPIWNKSAQTGVVRTSFGGRQKTLPKYLEVGNMSESGPVSQPKVVSSLSRAVGNVGQLEGDVDASSNGQGKLGTESFTDDSSTPPKTDRIAPDPQSSSREVKEAASIEMNASPALPPPATDLPPKKGSGKQARSAKKLLQPQPPPTGAPVKHECGGGTLVIPEMFVNNKPVEIENLRFEDFLDHLTEINSNVKFGKIKPQNLRVAFAKYIDGYYPPSRFSEAQKAAANATATTNATPGITKLTAKAVDKLKTGVSAMALQSQNLNLQQTEESSSHVEDGSQLLQYVFLPHKMMSCQRL